MQMIRCLFSELSVSLTAMYQDEVADLLEQMKRKGKP
jgi:hypothetical protein